MKIIIKKTLIALTLIATFTACEKENTEFLIPKGENNEVHLENSAYTHQSFFDLSSNSEVLSVEITNWDLEVETYGAMEIIKLNPSNSYRVFKTTSTDITDDIVLPESPDWTFDNPSGSITDRAFYNWSNNEVYIIGIKEPNNDPTIPSIIPFAKVSFEKTDAGINVNLVLEGETTVNKTSLKVTTKTHPYTWFSFEGGGESTVQPPSPDTYDLVITTYTGEVPDGAVTYIFELRGALTNRAGTVSSYRYNPGDVTDNEYVDIFNSLTKDDIEIEKYNVKADAIGYDWKAFSRTSMSYTIDKSNMYFIKDNNNNHYKLRFTNYYNNSGEQGFISFTYALL